MRKLLLVLAAVGIALTACGCAAQPSVTESRTAASDTPRSLAGAGGESKPFTIGAWREIDSEVLGEKRRIIVSTPRGYDRDEMRYPVLYLLDGEEHFQHTTGTIDALSRVDDIPPMLVVAVVSTDRVRDFTPAGDYWPGVYPTAGGADDFRAFLSRELIPLIDEEYRTLPYRVIAGHSFGGLFAIHTLVNQPELFDSYIAISPSLQWDEQLLVEQAEAFFHRTEHLDRSLYIAAGNEGGLLESGLMRLAASLEERSPRGFAWDTCILRDESHETVPGPGVRQGLEFVFGEWSLRNPLPLYEAGGVQAIYDHYRRSVQEFGAPRRAPWDAIYWTAVRLALAERFEEARAVLEHNPGVYVPTLRTYLVVGHILLDGGNRSGALWCFNRALEIDPAADGPKQALAAASQSSQ